MLCPYCGKEMDAGFVRGDVSIIKGDLYWCVSEYKDKLFYKWKKLAAHHHRLGRPVVKAYKCSECKKVIMETCIAE